jgi:hypothetical protein
MASHHGFKGEESTNCAFDDLLNKIYTLINDIPHVQKLGEDDLSDLFLEQSHNQTLDQCVITHSLTSLTCGRCT